MKLRVVLVGVLLAPVLGWAAASALASEPPQRFTACLSSGKLTSVATGDKPLVPCKSKQDQVSWAGQGPPGLPGQPGETGSPGPAGTDGPGRMPDERWLDLAASGTSATWSCSSSTCDVFGPGALEGAQSVGCGTITRTLGPMPPHSKVRIQATVGFVDDWQGDTAYLSVGTPDRQDVVWTQSHDQLLITGSRFSVVNDPRFPDVVGQAVDVIVSHAATSLTITFGTTLDCAAEAVLALDALSVSVAP